MANEVAIVSTIDEIIGNMLTIRMMIAEQTAQMVLRWAEVYVPVQTGSLYATIDKEELSPAQWSVNAGDTEGGYMGDATHPAGDPVDYAIDVEFGTGDQSAQPFMRPAAEKAFETVPEDAGVTLAATLARFQI